MMRRRWVLKVGTLTISHPLSSLFLPFLYHPFYTTLFLYKYQVEIIDFPPFVLICSPLPLSPRHSHVKVIRMFHFHVTTVCLQHLFSMLFRGGFRHVQHVRLNRGPTKMGPPHEDQRNFCNVPTHRNCLKVIEELNKIKILCGTGNCRR